MSRSPYLLLIHLTISLYPLEQLIEKDKRLVMKSYQDYKKGAKRFEQFLFNFIQTTLYLTSSLENIKIKAPLEKAKKTDSAARETHIGQ